MRILVNMATITNGGGLQASRSFVTYCVNRADDDIVFHFILSLQLHSYINDLLDKISFSLVLISPARFIKGIPTRKFILDIETNFRPDLIYSIGFPSYVFFRNLEIGRYTNPWEIYALNEAWSRLTVPERILRFLKSYIRRFYASRASFFETQTHEAAISISRTFHIPSSRIFISPNVINPEFSSYNATNTASSKLTRLAPNHYSIFVLSADHKHKNLSIIPSVAILLKELTNIHFTFNLTIPYDSTSWNDIVNQTSGTDIAQNIFNLGPLSLDQCLHQFSESIYFCRHWQRSFLLVY